MTKPNRDPVSCRCPPALYRAQVDYFVRGSEALVGDPRLREIAILRMSWLCRSGYHWGEHVKLGKEAASLFNALRVELLEGSPALAAR